MPKNEKLLHFDCRSGVSGDMLLAALASACPDPENAVRDLRDELISMGLRGLRMDLSPARVGGIVCNKMRLDWPGEQPLRTIADIEAIIRRSSREENVIDQIMKTVRTLGQAEASVHGSRIDQVRFHEVGALDTIVDIFGVHALVRRLEVVAVTATAINLGSGLVSMEHGTFPVPAPAVAELSINMEVFGSNLGMEAATPTGMALIKSLARRQGELPGGRVLSVGRGCGSRSCDERPTMLRAFVLEVDRQTANAYSAS